MVMSPVGLGTKTHCAGEGQQQFKSQSERKTLVERPRNKWKDTIKINFKEIGPSGLPKH
jgi:hypothetical protein